MCGIAGIRSLNQNNLNEKSHILDMTNALIHRGPDDEGYYFGQKTHLGHRRLSIIGIDDGSQPLYNDDKSILVVYNGEIYNYPELKIDLENKGYIFRTNTDTEVLVHMYSEYGESFIKLLNGMFSFALFDTKKDELLIGRDRFGVKPLFYQIVDNKLVFASEINSLKTLPYFANDIDYEALGTFISSYFIPEPWTAFKNVKRLKSGNYMKIKNGHIDFIEYYDYDFSKKDNTINSDIACEEIARLFKKAVKRQLMSDVPIGVLLSGGLDSRSILSVVSEEIPNTNTFTIGFLERAYSEGSLSSLWAEAYGSKHHEMIYTHKDLKKNLKNSLLHYGEPYGFFGYDALSTLAKKINSKDIKVVLSGTGGDELFAGYPTLHAANIARFYRLIPVFFRDNFFKKIINLLPAGDGSLSLAYKLKSFVNSDDKNLFRNFFNYKQVINKSQWNVILSNEINDKLKNHDPFVIFNQYEKKVSDLHFIDAMSYFDLKVFLGSNLFNSNDSEFMMHSVEQRVPFMDNDLVDFVMKIPLNVRFHPFKVKHLHRKSFTKNFPIPKSIQSIPKKSYKKMGFEIPINKWLREGSIKDLLNDDINKNVIVDNNFFNPDEVGNIIKNHINGTQNNERVIQNIYSVSLFLNNN